MELMMTDQKKRNTSPMSPIRGYKKEGGRRGSNTRDKERRVLRSTVVVVVLAKLHFWIVGSAGPNSWLT
jgi:hypothetical protein